MSSRALRRLEREREKALTPEPETEAQEAPYEPKRAQNLFALIGDEDESGGDEPVPVEIVKVSLPTKSQRKKGKKKKKQAKPAAEEESEDEFDKVLLAYGVEADAPIDMTDTLDLGDSEETEITHYIIDPSFRFFTTKKQIECQSLLSVDIKDLDPDNEFKKLFGNLSQEAIDDADSTTSTSIPPEQLQKIKRLARVVRGWGGRDHRSIPGTTRKLVFTKIRDDWMPTQKKDMSMEELTPQDLVNDRLASTEDWADVIKEDVNQELKHGIRYFRFDRGVDSRQADSQFYASAVLMPNHEALLQLLSRAPYHVETILQTALIFIRQGDKSNSNGLVERALFAFDRAFKQSFEVGNGLSRLPFNYYLNRQFHLALFRYIQVLTKKGTFYTAFTYAKLLLSFAPAEDPLGTRYLIDFYAIISGEHKWLVEFVESPLVKTYARWFTPGLAYSSALAYFILGDANKAKDALLRAYVAHPYVGYKLLEAIGLASDIPVHDYSIFEAGPETEAPAVAYLLQAPILWSEADQRTWLHDTLMGIIDSKPELKPMRQGEIPLNFIRFAILSDEGKVMAKIPQEWWDQNQIFEYDVLPPKEGHVETLEDFIEDRFLDANDDEDRMMEMVRNMSLQEMIDAQQGE